MVSSCSADGFDTAAELGEGADAAAAGGEDAFEKLERSGIPGEAPKGAVAVLGEILSPAIRAAGLRIWRSIAP